MWARVWVMVLGAVSLGGVAAATPIGDLAETVGTTISGYILEIAPVVLGVFAIIVGVAVIVVVFKYLLARF